MIKDLDAFKDKAQISVQTLAVVFLGWLASEISFLNVQLDTLNKQMVEVVVMTREHDRDIAGLKEFEKDLNREFVDRDSFESYKKETASYRERIWDALNEMRNILKAKEGGGKAD